MGVRGVGVRGVGGGGGIGERNAGGERYRHPNTRQLLTLYVNKFGTFEQSSRHFES